MSCRCIAICQQTLIANFTNAELQRHGLDVDGLLADPKVRKFVDWGGEQGSRFHRDNGQEAALICRAGLRGER
jgi:hypothetical protein